MLKDLFLPFFNIDSTYTFKKKSKMMNFYHWKNFDCMCAEVSNHILEFKKIAVSGGSWEHAIDISFCY